MNLSGKHLTLEEIVKFKNTAERSIYFYYNNAHKFEEFSHYTRSEIAEEKEKRLQELELSATLLLLTAIESWIRIDFIVRANKKYKDSLSKEFYKLYKEYEKVRLEDILDLWKKSKGDSLFSTIKEVMNYRNWLAHGMYWNFKNKKYSFDDLYIIAKKLDMILQSSPKQTYRYIAKK